MVYGILLAAGFSTRFNQRVFEGEDVGDNKLLVKVGPNNEELVYLNVLQQIDAGADALCIILGPKTGAIKNIIGDSVEWNGRKCNISYAYQHTDSAERDRPWGTADALVSIIPVLNEKISEGEEISGIVLVNGDDLYFDAPSLIYTEVRNGNDVMLPYKLGHVLPNDPEVLANRAVISIKDGHLTDMHEIFGISLQNLTENNVTPDTLCSINLFGLCYSTVLEVNKRVHAFKLQHKGDRKIESLIQHVLMDMVKDGLKIKVLEPLTKVNYCGITYQADVPITRAYVKNYYENALEPKQSVNRIDEPEVLIP